MTSEIFRMEYSHSPTHGTIWLNRWDCKKKKRWHKLINLIQLNFWIEYMYVVPKFLRKEFSQLLLKGYSLEAWIWGNF